MRRVRQLAASRTQKARTLRETRVRALVMVSGVYLCVAERVYGQREKTPMGRVGSRCA